MRVLVLSDIHANLAALDAVVEDAWQFDFGAAWCLGDIVGYGPDPNECLSSIRQLDALTVVGNHDWAVLERMEIDDFNPEARRAVLWTRNQLTPENLAWLSDLPDKPLVDGMFTLTHGSPRDPIWEYIMYPATAQANFEYFDTPYCLVGHTHVPAVYARRSSDASVRAFSPVSGRAIALEHPWPAADGGANGGDIPAPSGGDDGAVGGRAILNPGSVGQPRDNDPRTAYAILDTEARSWLPRRVAYPVEITQAHMRSAGLPERLINRLAYGW